MRKIAVLAFILGCVVGWYSTAEAATVEQEDYINDILVQVGVVANTVGENRVKFVLGEESYWDMHHAYIVSYAISKLIGLPHRPIPRDSDIVFVTEYLHDTIRNLAQGEWDKLQLYALKPIVYGGDVSDKFIDELNIVYLLSNKPPEDPEPPVSDDISPPVVSEDEEPEVPVISDDVIPNGSGGCNTTGGAITWILITMIGCLWAILQKKRF